MGPSPNGSGKSPNQFPSHPSAPSTAKLAQSHAPATQRHLSKKAGFNLVAEGQGVKLVALYSFNLYVYLTNFSSSG